MTASRKLFPIEKMSDSECKKDVSPRLVPPLPPPLPPPPPTGPGPEPRRSRRQRTRYTEEEVVSLAAIMQAHSRTGEPRGTLRSAHFASISLDFIRKIIRFHNFIPLPGPDPNVYTKIRKMREPWPEQCARACSSVQKYNKTTTLFLGSILHTSTSLDPEIICIR